MGLAILVILAVIVVVMAIRGVQIVQQAEAVIVERLGRYDRTLHSGINIIWPFLDQPRTIRQRYVEIDVDGERKVRFRDGERIDLRETVYDFPKQNVITRDNVTITIDALIYFQITDPMRAVYEIANLPDALEKLTQTTLRNVIGELDLDHTLTSRDTINAKLRAILDEATDKWGVKVNRVELQDIVPPADVKDAMEKQMRAERDRRAAILEAEGQKAAAVLVAEGRQQADVTQAEGEKRATALRAEGQAEAILRVAEAEAQSIRKLTEAMADGRRDPAAYLVAIKYIQALRDMVSGQESKVVYVPYEATSILGSIGMVRDLFEKRPGAE